MALPEGGVQPHQPAHNAKARMGVIVGGGILGVFLLIRGMGSSSSSGASSADQVAQAQQAQQAADQALYGQTGATGVADNGASQAQFANDVTSALGGVQTALQNLTAPAPAPAGDIGATAAPTQDPNAAALGGLLSQAITALGSGQHANIAAAPPASPGAAPAPATTTNPLAAIGAALSSAAGLSFGAGGGTFLNSLKSQGYKQTVRGYEGVGGTYTKRGQPTYYVFGGRSGQPFSIRRA